MPIIKLQRMRQLRVPFGIVESNIDLDFGSSIKFVSSADEVVRSDWRVMADLLDVNRAAVDGHLESLA